MQRSIVACSGIGTSGSLSSAAAAASSSAEMPRRASSASQSATASRDRASWRGMAGGARRSVVASSSNRGPRTGCARQACNAPALKVPAPACKRGTYNQELPSPGAELGGQASCHGSGAMALGGVMLGAPAPS